MTALGVHIGQQNMPMAEMRRLWRRLDEAGLDWLSVWDHIYEAPPAGGTIDHFEAIATLGALAADTERARLGCLVFYVGYRNPGLLAKAAVTLDHISGGRFELGLGGGWHQWEAEAYGYDFPSVGTRLDMLDESTELIASLLRNGDPSVSVAGSAGADGEIARTTFDGNYAKAADASCLPPPVGGRLPIWLGGLGEKRTLRTAARFADGWNAAYISAEDFEAKSAVLDRWCETEGRDPATIERSVNVAFYLAADEAGAAAAAADLDAQWGPQAERIRGGALMGTPDGAVDAIMAYVDAGADLVNIALRAPFDSVALDAYVDEVVPEVRRRIG
jgi:alkanesulfonate monooxygenase SsuD/methylene tetrahydromethanopterin reductase-like flavin-dependent oxidoreductase (luciferase family)